MRGGAKAGPHQDTNGFQYSLSLDGRMHWQILARLFGPGLRGGWVVPCGALMCPVEGYGKVAWPLGVVECLVGGGDLETGPRQKRHNTAGDFRSVDHGHSWSHVISKNI